MSPARVLALKRLDAIDLPGWRTNACRVRDAGRRVDPRDADLAERIVLGVERELLSIRFAIEAVSGRRLSQIDDGVQKVLAIAFEQLRSLDRVPPYAVVDDAVEMTRRFAMRSASGFVNAILRKAAAVGGRVPVGDATARVRAEREWSLPGDVFDRLVSLYGEAAASELAAGFARQPPLLARLIGEASLESLRAEGVEAVAHEDPRIVVLPPLRRDVLTRVARLVQPQDATSAAAIAHLDVRPGMAVLDRCCGRGTKTRQLLEAVGPTGRVTAMDTSEERLESLRAIAADAIADGRLRVIRAGRIEEAGLAGQAFDRVLIDAPCSNSGVFARRPGAKYRQAAESGRSMLALQRRILDDTAPAVAPGGSLQYTTCSIWPAENERQAKAFVGGHFDFETVAEFVTRPRPEADPTRWRDGGYSCVMRKR